MLKVVQASARADSIMAAGVEWNGWEVFVFPTRG